MKEFNMNFTFRKATESDIPSIWEILQQAIGRRKADGSNQWQDGYPNLGIVQNDIKNGFGFVLEQDSIIAGYCVVMMNDEPAYDAIEGQWLTNQDFVVVHRVAISNEFLGKGLAKWMLNKIEELALQMEIYSIKMDTNFDNKPMLHLMNQLGYVYCGEVYFRGSPRKAFEKVLKSEKL